MSRWTISRRSRPPEPRVPMPIAVKTRTYDQDFYEALRTHPATMGGADGETDPDEEMEDLFYSRALQRCERRRAQDV